jgi:hypothetical protein
MQVVFTARGASAVFYYVAFICTTEGGIPAGEELTYDYQWCSGAGEPMACKCGGASCRGRLGGAPYVQQPSS